MLFNVFQLVVGSELKSFGSKYINDTSTTQDYVTERVVQIQNKIVHITHIEFSFHWNLFRPSETLWFGRDNDTPVLAYLFYTMTSITHNYVASFWATRQSNPKTNPPILLTEISFNLSPIGPSETLQFRRDNGTTVFSYLLQ